MTWVWQEEEEPGLIKPYGSMEFTTKSPSGLYTCDPWVYDAALIGAQGWGFDDLPAELFTGATKLKYPYKGWEDNQGWEALGAAGPFAEPPPPGPDIKSELGDAIPALWERVPCPVCQGGGGTLVNQVMHLNDGHDWTREAIADWLDTLPLDLTFPVPDEIKEPEHVPAGS